MNPNPRIPADAKEVFAMGFMVGYHGWVPDELAHAFPDEPFEGCPSFIPSTLAHEWKQGYDCGVAFYCDHALEEE